MPKLISKLQHKTYEKGEFSEEAARDLDETIQMIKTFPWDLERGADVQLTGPSVTIQDTNSNYVKLGLYFGGKFCVYYLDKDNHLYEYHTPDINAAEKLVADFFYQTLDLKIFEKHLFNTGNKAHFITRNFEYRLRKRWIGLIVTLGIIYVGLMPILGFEKSEGNETVVRFFIFFLLFGSLLIFILIEAFEIRHQYLRISRGNNEFLFGDKKDEINLYLKSNIKEIIIIGGGITGVTDSLSIIFNNGARITLTWMLIQRRDFLSKLPDNLNIPLVYQR